MKPITIVLTIAACVAAGVFVPNGCHQSSRPSAPTPSHSPVIDQAANPTPWPQLKVISSTAAPGPKTPPASRTPSRLSGILDAFRHVAHIHRPQLPKIDAPGVPVAVIPPSSPVVVPPSPTGLPVAVVAHSALPASPSSTPTGQPPQATVKPNLTVRPLRLGLGHTTHGETAFTFDFVHRDIAVNPIGIRLKVGEWGAGAFVAKRIGRRDGFDVGPQVNYQTGRSFVGLGYEVRQRAGIVMVGTKF
jgi:hypothetical protein